MRMRNAGPYLLSLTALLLSSQAALGQLPKPETLLQQYRPVHSDFEFDTPTPAEYAQCRVDVERGQAESSFVVFGPSGQVLRRFTDTNGDGTTDLSRFYRLGLEVYRDIDTDGSGKPDEHRWMNWAGTKWAVDRNEDGRIDGWKRLSAHEAAQTAVEAMIRIDAALLQSVMVAQTDAAQLKLPQATTRDLLTAGADLSAKLRSTLSGSRVITARTRWMRFDPPAPGLIPAAQAGTPQDLVVYENAMALIQNGEKTEVISIGEMVQVGEVWKLTQLPQPLNMDGPQTIQLGGILMQPDLGTPSAVPGGLSEEMQQIIADLQRLDENSPAPDAGTRAMADYNRRRADLLEKIISTTRDPKEREQWVRQFVDGIAAAVQTGEYPDGLKRLQQAQSQATGNEGLLSFITYRQLQAEYAVRLQTTNEDEREASQKWWLRQLEAYSRKWPESEDASDAMAQLAISLELLGRTDQAKSWYEQLISKHPRTNAGIRARGALRRLSLVGRPMELSGQTLNGRTLSLNNYRGRITLVVFWASWAQPYRDDLPLLKAARIRYPQDEFDIVGVNLDTNAEAAATFVQQSDTNWQHIRDAGGIDGQLARDFGIISMPTMILVDSRGLVAGSVTAATLDDAIQALKRGEPLSTPRRTSANAAETPRQ